MENVLIILTFGSFLVFWVTTVIFYTPACFNLKTMIDSINKDGEEFTIKSIAFGNKVIVYLDEVSDRNKVEEIIPFEVYVDRELFPDTEEDEFYISDLVGLEVRVEGTEEVYGKVSSFYDNSAQVVLVIKGSGNQVQELPFIEEFFPIIDIEDGYITMVLPDFIEGKK